MPSWHCIRAWEPVKIKQRQQKKVAHGNRCSNLPKDFALIHDRGMKRHKAKRREASMRPRDKGSRKTETVSNSSANGASSPGLVVGLRAGSGHHFTVIGSSL